MVDAVVIGGGVLGQLTALALADAGRDVELLDAGPQRAPASWAGGGILSALFPWRYPDTLSVLTQHALRDYQRLGERIVAAGGPDPEARRTGMLVQAGAEFEQAMAWARGHGIPAMAAISDDVPEALRGGSDDIWMPEVGTLRNPRLLKGLAALLPQRGVRCHQCVVSRLQKKGGAWQLETDTGPRVARQVLVSAGAWSTPLLEQVGVRLPLMPVQGEMLLYGPTSPPLPGIILAEQGYVIPRADGQILVGSTLQAGVMDQRPTAKASTKLAAVAASLWPPLAAQSPQAQWAGIRPGSGRAWPWLGEVPGAAGVFVAAGHYRNGLVSAPASAAVLAALMNNVEPFCDPAPYQLP